MLRYTSAFGRVIVEKSRADKKNDEGKYATIARREKDVIHVCGSEAVAKYRADNGLPPLKHRVFAYKGARKERQARKHEANRKREERKQRERLAALGVI